MEGLLLIPHIFFCLAVYFRFQDNSWNLLEKKVKITKNYTWAVPLREIEKLIAEVPGEIEWKFSIHKAMRARKLHYMFVILTFISVIIFGYIVRIAS